MRHSPSHACKLTHGALAGPASCGAPTQVVTREEAEEEGASEDMGGSGSADSISQPCVAAQTPVTLAARLHPKLLAART